MKRSDALVVAALTALLALVVPAAYAGNPGTYVNQAAAETACHEWGAHWVNVFATDSNPNQTATYECLLITTVPKRYQFTLTGQPGGWLRGDAFQWNNGGDCPPGFGADPLNPAQCLDEQKCKDRPPLNDVFTVGMGGSGSTCKDGCRYSPPVTTCTVVNGQKVCSVASAKATGQTCGTGDLPPTPEKPQECVPAGDNQTFCLKPDGNHCHSTSNGRQVCWKPGETGEKDDGNVKQKRDAGKDPVPPNLQLPSGDNLQPKGPPVQTVTTTNNTTVNTVVQNYQTEHGTNAGTGNQGESDKGDGSGKENGDGKGASGGGDCKSPPIVTGDAVLGMVATQAWATRCAVEAGNAAKVSGDVGDCSQTFTVEGDNANALQLRAMRAQICGNDSNGNKRPDWTETNGTEKPGEEEGEGEKPGLLAKLINTDSLDASGFFGGGGSCPHLGTVDLKFTQVDLSGADWWCPFVTMCRAILLLMGAYISIRLLME